MTTFGSLIRSYRLRAGLGLRTFATLIDERASVVSAIESGRRAPWRSSATLHRVVEVLGLVESSNLWQKILELAHEGAKTPLPLETEGSLAWWWRTEEAPELDAPTLAELATFVGATIDFDRDEQQQQTPAPLTELAIEWRVRRLLGRREVQVATAPVDVEAALENEACVQLEIVPGLIPRFSVQACVVATSGGLTLFIDRIVADSRPMASYRHLLALSFAPSALWQADTTWHAAHFRQLQATGDWPGHLRDCERFALAMLLPANPVLAGAETAYVELIQQQDRQQQGWIELDDATRTLRNRLAEQFAVPPSLVHRRLVSWPCHLYGRIAQALAAEEPTLPPLDWLVPEKAPRQQTLFEMSR
ncbi:MAG: helix-turn-helix transcriptional regulator [Planctomycetes bacterium]|nr:helix-turn-helix transcriptional regulator [Planctomycetota bacterium]